MAASISVVRPVFHYSYLIRFRHWLTARTGLWQSTVNSHITKADFYELLGISYLFTPVNVSWAIWDTNEDGSTGALLQRTQDLLPNGKYLILTPCM